MLLCVRCVFDPGVASPHPPIVEYQSDSIHAIHPSNNALFSSIPKTTFSASISRSLQCGFETPNRQNSCGSICSMSLPVLGSVPILFLKDLVLFSSRRTAFKQRSIRQIAFALHHDLPRGDCRPDCHRQHILEYSPKYQFYSRQCSSCVRLVACF